MSEPTAFLENSSSCVDLLYDYAPFLQLSEAEGRIGYFPPGISTPRVAIVGAGISGLVAATELLRAGVNDITLFEARDRRIGGRAWSQVFDPRYPHLIAEMGAMRFPSSETCLFHYLNRFDITTTASFPDPGVVDTELHYRGVRHIWSAGDPPPSLFSRVHEGWLALLNEGYLHNGVLLAAPKDITAMLKSHCFDKARKAWQAWLDAFRDCSFYSALVVMFTSNTPPGGVPWRRPDDFELFGSLGIGSGGFLPVYQAGFTEILRLVINGYEEDQRLIIGGISTLTERLAGQYIDNTCLSEHICFSEIRQIYKENDDIKLVSGRGQTYTFDRVIVTSCTRTMQIVHGLTGDETFLEHDTARAVKETHLTGSSKLFMLTQNKFWLKHSLPVTIQSDGFIRGVYCLDYEPDNPDGPGVILLSYTWEDDAHKLLSIPDKKQRCQHLVDDLANIHPEFARHLVPADGDYERYVLHHDWLVDPYSAGAFKLNYPGEDVYSQRLFFQFKNANTPEKDTGLYLAGCGCSFTGGWIEGAIQTALNSACAVIRSTGGTLLPGNPLDAMHSVYCY
ncbi:NAD(P)/FAD-dependent oxidoreductase [Dickeya dianthicola]|uniref:NAD(P)/FAD-dependent oxidoreductase n=1 Tax=Dickeya dianthicola TaxID=204039 RepID=UPI001F60FD66|nr:NAD(P)/FAD-dependent oxidoreductase [Dickeya dianthicola]MCI4201444.1 FAD-dependent oxidoreductase [Dickeya dianthicola]MCI4213070.1 FAD-dependent oxidoreductase [Dickeya dianthicola]MCI4223521.1 FAD-dependent oxidoreductase [Dickeya dianthicola]